MDLASVVAALASVGVRVSGSTPNSSVQVDSSRACPTGLAGPEPSGTINDPGQHFQAAAVGDGDNLKFRLLERVQSWHIHSCSCGQVQSCQCCRGESPVLSGSTTKYIYGT